MLRWKIFCPIFCNRWYFRADNKIHFILIFYKGTGLWPTMSLHWKKYTNFNGIFRKAWNFLPAWPLKASIYGYLKPFHSLFQPKQKDNGENICLHLISVNKCSILQHKNIFTTVNQQIFANFKPFKSTIN